MNISDDELKVLESIAKAKGITVEEALSEIRGDDQEVVDDSVTFSPEPQEAEPMVFIGKGEDKPEKKESVARELEADTRPSDLPPQAEEDEQDNEADKEESGAATLAIICPQCGWDHENEVIPEPSDKAKLSYLHSVLGQKSFSHDVQCFNGHLRLRFRSLTTGELGAICKYSSSKVRSSGIVNHEDYFSYMNRCRVFLQLVSYKSGEAQGVDLPDGLSKATNRAAKQTWESKLGEAEDQEIDELVSLFDRLEEYVIGEVLSSESLYRVVTHECNKFNRLLGKLEACVDNPNFWPETGTL